MHTKGSTISNLLMHNLNISILPEHHSFLLNLGEKKKSNSNQHPQQPAKREQQNNINITILNN
jgi:hypothetical protein